MDNNKKIVNVPVILAVMSIVIIMGGFAICSDARTSKAGDIQSSEMEPAEAVSYGLSEEITDGLEEKDSSGVEEILDEATAVTDKVEVQTKKASKKSNLTGTWPADNELAKTIPKPMNGNVKTVQKTDTSCAIYLTMTFEQCKEYVDTVISEGNAYDKKVYDDFVSKKTGEVQFGKSDGKGFKVQYISGLVKIAIFDY